LQSCTGECGDGLTCLCGVCTLVCESDDICEAQARGAVCVFPDEFEDALQCDNCTGSSRVCDIRCKRDGECTVLGEEFSCQAGFCRDDGFSSQVNSDGGTGGGTDRGANGEQVEPDAGPQQSEAGTPVPLDAGDADAGRPEDCLDPEICNGKDDDCDGETDEDFDLNSNLNHCGSCAVSCVRDHAFSQCNKGVCEMLSCDFGFVDLDGDEENGCEYYCVPDDPPDEVCDLKDNDCNGGVDDAPECQGSG
jgi:hypothetical protein